MKRISSREFEKQVENVREKIYLSLRSHGFRGTEIEVYRLNWKDTTLSLNWAGIGTRDKAETREFAAALMEAAEFIEAVEMAEIDWSMKEESIE